jgi:probable addiction module antidote protein
MNLSTKTPSSSLKEDTEELVNSLNRMLQSAQNDAAEIAAALGRIAKNYGMSRLSRESLYRTLSGQCSPEFSTILKIIRALNLNFAVTDNSSSK